MQTLLLLVMFATMGRGVVQFLKTEILEWHKVCVVVVVHFFLFLFFIFLNAIVHLIVFFVDGADENEHGGYVLPPTADFYNDGGLECFLPEKIADANLDDEQRLSNLRRFCEFDACTSVPFWLNYFLPLIGLLIVAWRSFFFSFR